MDQSNEEKGSLPLDVELASVTQQHRNSQRTSMPDSSAAKLDRDKSVITVNSSDMNQLALGSNENQTFAQRQEATQTHFHHGQLLSGLTEMTMSKDISRTVEDLGTPRVKPADIDKSQPNATFDESPDFKQEARDTQGPEKFVKKKSSITTDLPSNLGATPKTPKRTKDLLALDQEQQQQDDESISTMKNSSGRSHTEFDRMLKEKFYGVFDVGEKAHMYSKSSLYCLDQHNCGRKLAVRLMVNKWFERFITFCIIANSLLLASKEYDQNFNADYVSSWNETLDKIDLVFSIIFLFECIVKVIAMGFVVNKKSYLRSAWNCIDFFIVIVSVIGIIGPDNSSLKAFRTARILRPLRSMHQLVSMRSLIQTFIASIPGLFNVCIFQTFIFTIFAIIGVNFFVGTQYQFCRATDELVDNGVDKPYWPINEDAAWQCSTDEMCGSYPNNLGDDAVAKCGDVYRDYGLDPVEYDGALQNEMINFDITNFNSVLAAALTLFQVITLEGWSQLMYNYQDTVSYTTASIFFVFVIILGAFTTLNLILASIMHSYLQQEQKEAEVKRLQEEQLAKANRQSNTDNSQLHTSQVAMQLINEPQIQTQKSAHLSVIQENDSAIQANVNFGQTFGDNAPNQGSLASSQKKKEVVQEQSPQMSSHSMHFPTLNAQNNERIQGILKHQELENRAELDADNFAANNTESQASPSQRNNVSLRDSTDRKSLIIYDQHQSGESQRDMDIPLGNKYASNTAPQLNAMDFQSPSGFKSTRDMTGQIPKIKNMHSSKVQPMIVLNNGQDDPFEESQPDVQLRTHLRASSYENIVVDPMIIEQSKSTDQDEVVVDAESRADKNKCYGFFYQLVSSVTFNFLIYCFIMGNTVTLAMYRFDQSQRQTELLAIFDTIFVWIFFAEMIAKLIGLGFRSYARDKFNIFDGIIVIISLVDFALQQAVIDDSGSENGIMNALRALRLLRVIKLSRHWKAFQEILHTMIESVVDISNFTILLTLFIFIAALLGMELFAYSVYFDQDGEPVFGKETIQEAFRNGEPMVWPRANFNNIFNSLVAVFIVIIAEDWNQVMYLYVRALGEEDEGGRKLALAYFILLFTIGNIIFLALFTALLLKSQNKNIEEMTEKLHKKAIEKAALKKSAANNSTPCQRIAQCCTRKNCGSKCSSFSDTFVKIFGGDQALTKRQKARQQKNPKLSASPISGNAIQPKPQHLQIKVESVDIYARESNESDRSQRKKNDNPFDLSSFVNADAIDTTRAKPLQRPTALLHYDYEQADQVKMRSVKIKSEKVLMGKSLYLFDEDNALRRFCATITRHWIFDNIVIVLIIISTVSLAFEHPMDDPNSDKTKTLFNLDLAMTACFTLEMVLKIITLGFVMNGPKSYLSQSWNVLDFIIVFFSILSLGIKADLSIIKVFRVARILRPLRLISHAEGLKVAIQALYKAIPQIMRLQVVFLFIMFMISILMTTLLSGKLSKCDTSHMGMTDLQNESLITDKLDCLAYGGHWRPAPLNFDNTAQGLLTLFIFQSREGWVNLMWDSVDAAGIDQAGIRNNQSMYIILYMVLVIILCLLFVNMFVRVVIQTFQLEKDFLSFNTLLTDQQRSWIQVQLMTYKALPAPLLKDDAGTFLRNLCIKIAQHRYFDNFIMLCIVLNTIVMALIWHDEPAIVSSFVEVANYVFLVIFTVEAVIKIVAFRKLYFHSSWNIFDFTIVVITLIILGLNVFNVPIEFGSGPTVLRALRIGRILRLIKRAQKLQIIFHTLLDSAASLGSLGLLLIILFFMFAIIGRSMFGLARIGDPNEELNEHVNFRDFSTSFLLLMRCSTGESWHIIMFDLARGYSADYQCRENETYESMMANGGEPFQCGNPAISITFFVLFHILVFQVFINLFVAIIIDAFLGQTDHFKLPIQKYSISEFVTLWSFYDPEATGFINIKDLEIFVYKLAKSYEGRELVILHEKIVSDYNMRRRFIAQLNIPTFNQGRQVMFYDVLQQLCDKVNQLNFNREKILRTKKEKHVLKQFGAKNMGVGDDLSIILSQKDNSFDFEKTIRNMGRLNPKIKLMLNLQAQFRRIHEKYAIYADNEQNIHLTDAARRAMKLSELRQLNQQNVFNTDDVNVYTTKHYFYGKFIQRAWRRRVMIRKNPDSKMKYKMLRLASSESGMSEIKPRKRTILHTLSNESNVVPPKPQGAVSRQLVSGVETPASRDLVSANSNMTSVLINEEMQRANLPQLNPLFPEIGRGDSAAISALVEEQKEQERAIVDQELHERQETQMNQKLETPPSPKFAEQL